MEEDKKNQLTESEISMLLDTFMYLNYREAEEGQTLKEILADLETHPDYGGGGIHAGEYRILEQAVGENSSLGELQIGAQSFMLGFDPGTSACMFFDEATDTYYIVYRGTGDGEWLDNGLGMTNASTMQQEKALCYFNKVVEEKKLTASDHIVITGHSKGGNKAQYVTMEAKDGNLIDTCYSIDGQGFSELAIDGWKKKHGTDEYDARVHKIYGIQGENDYVNVLGHCIILPENNRYIKTPVKNNNFAGFHDIKYMYAVITEGGETVYTGQRNHLVTGQGELGSLAAKLSENIMSLGMKERAGCAAVIMQLLELGGERKTGLNGEKAGFTDLLDFVCYGLPSIVSSVLFTDSGKKLLSDYFYKNTGKSVIFEVCPLVLAAESENMEQIVMRATGIAEETESILAQLEEFMKHSFKIRRNLQKEIRIVRKEANKIRVLSETLKTVADIYISYEQNVVSI